MDEQVSDERIGRPGTIAVSANALSIASAVIAVSCLTALLFVATAGEALETVAISLAIIAFVVQIIIFIAQAAAAHEQGVQAQELHGALQGILAQVSERAADTQSTVNDMNRRVIDLMVRGEQSGLDLASPDGFRQVVQLSQQEVSVEPGFSRITNVGPDDLPPKLSSAADDARILGEIRSTMPTAEAARVREDFSQIPSAAVEKLERFMADEIKHRRDGSSRDPGLVSSDDWLIGTGLIERTGQQFMNSELWRLTPLGRQLTRAILSAEDGQVSEGPFRFINRSKFL